MPLTLLHYAGKGSLVHLETPLNMSPSRAPILHLRIHFFLKLIGFESCTIVSYSTPVGKVLLVLALTSGILTYVELENDREKCQFWGKYQLLIY